MGISLQDGSQIPSSMHCPREWQPLYESLKFGVEFRQELPLLEDHPTGQGPKLIVIDDFMDEIKSHHKEILRFFIKGSHHRNLSIFFLSQCLFPDGLRQISLNAHYIVLFKTSRDLAQIRTFCMQVDPQHFRALLEAYEDATRAGYTYIMFDFKPNQEDHMRMRTLIFPGESTVVYIPRAKYKRETMTVL
ncbi:Putative B3 domain-containing protein [Frankliniella fusca]|uniref:B3 domain-containing protein n=1 Tax=Frankliniella fusca TaxID=407009 RepID=A0AAE1HP90_9NEOP|nr:Putative B3 domain-containing protein [Frankliniella fusca]KAK3924196.1 Putative B3 domain-containing protein [Frankliniella fusca]